MMDMTVSVYDENGLAHDIRDFLVFTPSMMWRVIHFANSADLMTEYESGKLCSDCVIERSVKVKVIVEQGSEIPQDKLKGKQPGSKYPDKNKIDDYIKKDDVRTKMSLLLMMTIFHFCNKAGLVRTWQGLDNK